MRLEFSGTNRFQIIRTLGRGGTGTVYEVLDRERDARVALKALRNLNPEALYEFKREFRAFQDIQHPNLISVGELFSENDDWFFTMELIEGVDFLTYVSTHGAPPSDSNVPCENDGCMDGSVHHLWPSPSSDPAAPVMKEQRLRSALRQVAEGLSALHELGKIHRDIKPGNILVSREGRAVILDFGLAIDNSRGARLEDSSSSLNVVAGTIDYMSPEQAAGLPLDPATDWYSVGVMLYQSLTGRLPFPSKGIQTLLEKQRVQPPRAGSLTRVPQDLDDLCARLLSFTPAERPDGTAILAQLGTKRPSKIPARLGSDAPLFVGRRAELEVLLSTFKAVTTGKTVAVHITGPSGIGKSTLVKQLTNSLRQDGQDVAILAGRCYERESVPFKGVDGVIDSLSHFLRRLPKREASAMMPRNAALLGQGFPVLQRVEAVASAPILSGEVRDPRELRSRLFAVVRETLIRLADRYALIVIIDDLQWADADSLSLLTEVLRPPDAPVLLLLAISRDDDPKKGAVLRITPEFHAVELGAMSPDDARQLAERLAEQVEGPVPPDLDSVVRDAAGHPLFLRELIRYAGDRRGVPARVEDIISDRIESLDAVSKIVVQLTACAGGPVSQEILGEAAQVSQAELVPILRTLKTQHLVRTTGTRSSDFAEPFHDRIRKAAQQSTDSAWGLHRRLALSLQMLGGNPEALAYHWKMAGDAERAAQFSLTAAQAAVQASAFDRAASLFRDCIDLGGARLSVNDRRALQADLADCLANAGRGEEAGDAYIEAGRGSVSDFTTDMNRKAADQYLRSGRFDKAQATISQLLQDIGISLPTTPARALASLLIRRAKVRMRGLSFRETPESSIAPKDLSRIDTCWAAAAGYSMIDTIRGADLQTRHMLHALKAGESYRIARALALEAGYASLDGQSNIERAQTLLRTAEQLSKKVDHPHALGMTYLVRGIVGFQFGWWKSACEGFEAAETLLREKCRGTAWEVATAHMFGPNSAFYLGNLTLLRERVPALLADAKNRGDIYAVSNLCLSNINAFWLIEDEPQIGRTEARMATENWSPRSYFAQHFYNLIASTNLDSYTGRFTDGLKRIHADWPVLQKSMLLRIQTIRTVALQLRAQLALACLSAQPTLARDIERDVNLLAKERTSWAQAFSDLYRGALLLRQKRSDRAQNYLEAALKGFRISDMALHAVVAQCYLAQAKPADEQRSMLNQAREAFKSGGVKVPDRMLQVYGYFPG
jgi:serine/threonine protein kinase/tetratricopeptide (TPR) repeat protein